MEDVSFRKDYVSQSVKKVLRVNLGSNFIELIVTGERKMWEKLIINVVFFVVGCIIGGWSRYFWNTKFFLYKKRIQAEEKLRKAVEVFSQRHLLFAQLRRFDLNKVENADITDQEKIEKVMNMMGTKDTIEKILKELQDLHIQSEIKPYIKPQLWKIFDAYLFIITSACLILSCVPYSLKYLKKDKIKEEIIKYVISVIPEEKDFIEEDPLKNVFFVEDLVRKKLFEEIEKLNLK